MPSDFDELDENIRLREKDIVKSQERIPKLKEFYAEKSNKSDRSMMFWMALLTVIPGWFLLTVGWWLFYPIPLFFAAMTHHAYKDSQRGVDEFNWDELRKKEYNYNNENPYLKRSKKHIPDMYMGDIMEEINKEYARIEANNSYITLVEDLRNFNREIHNKLSNTSIKDVFSEEVNGIRYTKELVTNKKREIENEIKKFAKKYTVLKKYA